MLRLARKEILPSRCYVRTDEDTKFATSALLPMFLTVPAFLWRSTEHRGIRRASPSNGNATSSATSVQIFVSSPSYTSDIPGSRKCMTFQHDKTVQNLFACVVPTIVTFGLADHEKITLFLFRVGS